MRKEKMHAMTRRAFGRSASLLATVAAVSACTNRRGGTDDTTASADLPAVRQYVRLGSSPTFSGVDFDHVSPDPATVEGTVATAVVEPTRSQRLFLWEQESVPSTTAANGSGYDPAGFRPTVASVLAVGDTVRGAVLLCAGGAFAVHGDNSDCYPTATQMSALGYHCFVVDYRVRPYTQAEAGVDLARGIRFVRAHTDDYGLPSPQHIALIGYSAGGILCGETILNWSGATSPTELDADYAPDMLDAVSADAAATAMIYSFYGRLSVAELNPDRLVGAVPTYYCYSTTDPFYDQFEAQVEVFGGGATSRCAPVSSAAGRTDSVPREVGSRSTPTSCSRPSRPPDAYHRFDATTPDITPSSPDDHQPRDSHGRNTSMSDTRTVLVIGATGQVGRVVVEEALTRGLSVRAQSRNAARAARSLNTGAEIVEATPTDAASLAAALNGVDVVVLTHGGDSDLEHHYYAVLPALLDALAGRPEVHISLMTSMHISHPSGESWDWKRRAERLVRASGHPYTIVRPGWFDYQGAEDTQVDLRQGDLVEGQPGVDRHHIAQVLIEGAINPSGEHRTVEVFSRPGAPVTDFEKLFANTQPDTETGGVPSTRTSCQSEMSPPACRPISPASAPN